MEMLTKRNSESRPNAVFALVAAVAFVLMASVFGLAMGASSIGVADVVRWAVGMPVGDSTTNVLANVRAPRVAAGLMSGFALAIAGVLIQSALDNPLASPNVVGVNAGAGFFVLAAAAFFPSSCPTPLAAFVGAAIAAFAAFVVAQAANASKLAVVLAGMAISSIFGAGMNLVLIVDPDAYVGSAAFLAGGLSGVLTEALVLPGALVLVGFACALACASRLNVLSLGERSASSVGLNVRAFRLAALCTASLLAGCAVSVAGLLGFVGLLVPHAVRAFVGEDNRLLVPLSGFVGAGFVVICDLVARTAFAPYEIPVGILMALLGGPFFILLLLRSGRGAMRR